MVGGLVLFFTSWERATGAAQPATSTNGTVDYSVTMAARVCPTYTDVFANRARNNIMESLQDLGPDSPYTNFVAVDPSVEDGLSPADQLQAAAELDVRLRQRHRQQRQRDQPELRDRDLERGQPPGDDPGLVPLLDTNGNPTGQQIAGATTFTLTVAELSLASRGNFWVMGGTPSRRSTAWGSSTGSPRCGVPWTTSTGTTSSGSATPRA